MMDKQWLMHNAMRLSAIETIANMPRFTNHKHS